MFVSRLLVLAACSFASLAPAQSTWYVDAAGTPPGNGSIASPYTSIQYAIARPTTLGGDTVRVLPGNYVENIDFLGKAITVESSGGAGATAILGHAGGVYASCVSFRSGEIATSRLRGFTLSGGWGSPDPTFSFWAGGGLYIENASPRIQDCVVSGNDAQFGAGVYVLGGAPSFTGCTIANQGVIPSTYFGGGLRCESASPTLVGTTIESNWASTGGGASFSACHTTLTACTVRMNYGYDSAGLHFDGGSAHVSDSNIEGNYAGDGWGGGIAASNCALVLTDVNVRSNTSDNDHAGGGIYASGGSLTMTRGELVDNFSDGGGGLFAGATTLLDGVLIAQNVAHSFQAGDGNGGGVWAGGSVTLRSCVIAYNDAIQGPSLQGQGGGVYGPATLDRCTLWGNTATNTGGAVCGGATLSNCIVWSNSPVSNCGASATWSDVQGGSPGTGNFSLGPQLAAPINGDFRLKSSSPCIDAGDPALSDADGSRADVGAIPLYQGGGVAYCTAGTSAQGCVATIDGAGDASLSRDRGFTLSASGGNGAVSSAIFWGSAATAAPWGSSSSWICIAMPRFRTGLQVAGGAAGTCNGVIVLDFNTWLDQSATLPPPAGSHLFAQGWYRDPTSIKKSALSNAVEFVLLP